MTSARSIYRLEPTPLEHKKTVQEEQNTNARILVVEDDLHLMEGIREILELDEYVVLTANSGVEGLETLKTLENLPDLIVSDIMMPKMDGYEFFETVRAENDWLSIPFIFLTAKGEKADIRLGKKMGADDYVTKPFGAEDLLVAVSSKLARQQQLQSALSGQVTDLKNRILTILNHEFRTPLTYVIAYADMLNRDASELSIAELREFLKGINSGADRLRRLVENFIFLVEIETGEVEITFSWRKRPVRNFQKIADMAIRSEQYMLDEHKQKAVVTIESDAPPVIGDEEYLSAALSRLLNNASKFSQDGDTIHLNIQKGDDGYLDIQIKDPGRGIPQHELDNIFDSFYQINRQKYEDQGAGSGLAIVRGIAQIHEAEIRVESVEGNGSIFSLRIPPTED